MVRYRLTATELGALEFLANEQYGGFFCKKTNRILVAGNIGVPKFHNVKQGFATTTWLRLIMWGLAEPWQGRLKITLAGRISIREKSIILPTVTEETP